MSTKDKINTSNVVFEDDNTKYLILGGKTNDIYIKFKNLENRIYLDQTGNLPKKGI